MRASRRHWRRSGGGWAGVKLVYLVAPFHHHRRGPLPMALRLLWRVAAQHLLRQAYPALVRVRLSLSVGRGAGDRAVSAAAADVGGPAGTLAPVPRWDLCAGAALYRRPSVLPAADWGRPFRISAAGLLLAVAGAAGRRGDRALGGQDCGWSPAGALAHLAAGAACLGSRPLHAGACSTPARSRASCCFKAPRSTASTELDEERAGGCSLRRGCQRWWPSPTTCASSLPINLSAYASLRIANSPTNGSGGGNLTRIWSVDSSPPMPVEAARLHRHPALLCPGTVRHR